MGVKSAVVMFLNAIGYGAGFSDAARLWRSARMREAIHAHDAAGRMLRRRLEVSRRGAKVFRDGSVSGRRALRGLAVAREK